MQFVGGIAKKSDGRFSKASRCQFLGKGIDEESEKELYSTTLSFYDTPPQATLSLLEFEKYALARLKVLRLIERINLTSVQKYSIDWKNAIYAEIKKQELWEFDVVLTGPGEDESGNALLMEARKFDHISHFLLRLAFARTEDQRKWFISLEMDLFRLKLGSVRPLAIMEFLKFHGFPGKEISKEELDDKNLMKNINTSTFTVSGHEAGIGAVFKVPFQFALDLVRHRRVYLKRGLVYVPVSELNSVICGAFRSYLSESISIVKKRMYLIEQDQRIVQLIEDFDQRHTGNDYVSKKLSSTAITAAQLPTLSQKSFPLCMKSLYEVVTKEHHLKHFGRLQLGLFFKGMEVPLDEAIKFWRGHFTRRPEIDGVRFDKQYLYNIRHMYGQEGRRADYTPYSCMKVITSNVGPGDHHGCPFKHSDQPSLRTKLVDAQIPSKGIKEIMDLIEGNHFQIACQKYFEWTHDNMTVDGGVNHPNQYFEESRAVLGGKKTIKAEDKGPKPVRTLIYADGRSSQSQAIKMETNSDEVNEKSDLQMEIEENAEVDLIMASLGYE